MLEKAAAIKRLEYSPFGKELKKETSVAEEQYQELDDTFEFDKIVKKENYSKSNPIYDTNHSFYKYFRDSKEIDNLSLKSKHSFLDKFFDDLDKFKPNRTGSSFSL